MLPVEVLISEHRLIERFVKFIGQEMEKITETHRVEPNFIVVESIFSEPTRIDIIMAKKKVSSSTGYPRKNCQKSIKR